MSTTENGAVALLRVQIKGAFRAIKGLVADLTPEDAHWQPPGKALPAGAVYAQVVIAMDAVVNRILKGGTPLFAGEWAGKGGSRPDSCSTTPCSAMPSPTVAKSRA